MCTRPAPRQGLPEGTANGLAAAPPGTWPCLSTIFSENRFSLFGIVLYNNRRSGELFMRPSRRASDEMRAVSFERGLLRRAEGS
jgi:hypothetical protein